MSVVARVALFAALALPAAAVPAAAHDHDHGRGEAHRSLRQPVTDQNFYFVMADRFANGTTANDHGGLPPGKLEGQSGYDPAGTGWYHGGDLKGLRERLDYIKGLGTTAIWLTPSFKNKAVQPEDFSAGYHGYWITDFTQIDPHLGSNEALRRLIDAAHARQIKVYFDIITNHTADVIKYTEGGRQPYTSKDEYPYRTAMGNPFDDRDFAGTNRFPQLAPTGQPPCETDDPGPLRSFPYHPCVREFERDIKVPAWLNDVSAYHNRGDTTFTGEDSFYGDFFGLDDLFTEQPRVVEGMIDIYKLWIRDFRIDGFRMDTMRHVDDAFWQRFSPAIVEYAQRHGIRDFYMFGEVADDVSVQNTSHYSTRADVQGVLDFPFQMAAVRFAAESRETDNLRDLFLSDDWYTDGDSNVYNLPTFLGNHDRGRIGMYLRNANPGATEDELLARDKLAHALMYFARGNPVIYYGDEQGFTGAGGDQQARQDMFPSLTPAYGDAVLNNNIGSDESPLDDNFDPGHRLYREIARLADVTRRHPALRDGTQQHRVSSSAPGIYAFSRIDCDTEYVVALNNAETAASAAVPTYIARGDWEKVYGDGPSRLRSGSDKRLSVSVAPLGVAVYRAKDEIPRSRKAPAISLNVPASGYNRLPVRANVAGDGPVDVTFLARVGHGRWQDIGTDDNAPYTVYHDVADVDPGTRIEYRAVVLDNGRHTRSSATRSAVAAPPAIALEVPADGQRVRGKVTVRAVATPEQPWYSVTFERSVDGGQFTRIGTDDSSPAYTVFDDTSSLPDGARVTYRAVLNYARGRTVTSAPRTVTVVQARVTSAVIHYNGDATRWGLHLFGDALAPGEATPAWETPTPFEGTDAYGVFHQVAIANDTARVGFVVHGRPPAQHQDVKDGENDRFFTPLATPEIWLRQGDTRIYSCPQTNETCVVT